MTPPRVDDIKARLWACDTVEQVNALAREVDGEVADMADHPTQYIHAVHIRNLAALMRLLIEAER